MSSLIIFHFLSSVGSQDPPVATALHMVFKLHKYFLFLLCPCILGQEDGAQELPFGNYFGLVKLGLTVFGA